MLPKKCIKRIVYASSKWTCRLLDYKIWGVMQQRVYRTKICDIYDLQKCLTHTWVDFQQNVIEAAIDQWRDRLRSCVRYWWRTL